MNPRLDSLDAQTSNGIEASAAPASIRKENRLSLTDELVAEANPTKPCIAGRWFDTLDATDRAEAADWLAKGGTKAALLRVARNHGYTGSSAMFYAHTTRDCPCSRKD